MFTFVLLTEPVDGGTEMVLKLRLSSTCMDVKLPVCTKDTIGMAKKKLQVSQFYNTRQFSIISCPFQDINYSKKTLLAVG